MEAAREQLEVTQEEFAKLCGLGLATIQRIESGEPRKPWARTLKGLDRGAGWRPGSARALLERGIEPTPGRISDSDLEERVLRDDIERELFLITELKEDIRWAKIIKRRRRIAEEQAKRETLRRKS